MRVHRWRSASRILIRNDSSILISPDTYRQHVAPCDERVLQECGGGGIHSCGDCSHVIDEFLKLPSIQSIDLGQPELLDVDAIYEKTSNEQVALIGVTISREEVESGSAFDRFPTGVVLRYRADSFEEACEVGQDLSKSTKDTFN